MSTKYNNRQRLEKLRRHKALTSTVRRRLREHKTRLENDIHLINLLLEKPLLTEEAKNANIFGELKWKGII